MAMGRHSTELHQKQYEENSTENEIDILLQITENVWVQCENPDCQKWRKVPMDVAAGWGPDTPWFCSMNPDPTADSCSKAEEKHAKYHEVARKAGIKFVFSQLGIGELVWAKTPGYCRWPAIITKDPDCGLHVSLDMDGDPLAYHVEYLGDPHTHCWVTVAQVETYGHKYTHSMDNMKKKLPKSTKVKKKYKRGKLTLCKESYKGQYYGQYNLRGAIQEADDLLPMAKSARLQCIVFEFGPEDADLQEKYPLLSCVEDSGEKLEGIEKDQQDFVRDLLDSPHDLDAMMKELEEDIDCLTPCSEDCHSDTHVDSTDEFGCLDDMDYFPYSTPPSEPVYNKDREVNVEDDEEAFLLDDIESDLSTMEDFFDNV